MGLEYETMQIIDLECAWDWNMRLHAVAHWLLNQCQHTSTNKVGYCMWPELMILVVKLAGTDDTCSKACRN